MREREYLFALYARAMYAMEPSGNFQSCCEVILKSFGNHCQANIGVTCVLQEFHRRFAKFLAWVTIRLATFGSLNMLLAEAKARDWPEQLLSYSADAAWIEAEGVVLDIPFGHCTSQTYFIGVAAARLGCCIMTL